VSVHRIPTLLDHWRMSGPTFLFKPTLLRLFHVVLQVFFLSEQDNCRFFQWIDGPKLVDRQILLFLYDRNESSLLQSFKHWIPPPPNPPPMTDEEKDKASTRRVCNPPTCKCGYHAELVNLPLGLDYTPFFCCPITLSVILDNMLYILL
jgi:hypothetical protein